MRTFAIRRRPLRLGRRILRISLSSALILSLPIVFVVAWSAWSAYARFERYRRHVKADVTLDAELLQIFAHDELTRQLRRLRLPGAPNPSTLPTFELALAPDALTTLEADARSTKKRRYVDATLRKDGRIHDVQVRHQGRRHWHALGVQKSMKVRTDKGDLVDGVRVFNLLNGVTPFGFEESIILDLARDGGLLSPAFHAVRVRVNNADLGVYRFEAQPDEGLLRRQARMPGSLYSGDFAKKSAKEPHGGWSKFGAASAAQREDYAEIDTLLAKVRGASHADFATYAADHVDLDRFALFDALDVVFGGDQHDFDSNQKLYYDPYRERFEPIARDFRAFSHEPFVNRAESPIQLRLKALPDYLWRRDRHVYRLLDGAASVARVRADVDRRFEALLPELAADPYWDAYKLLPRASRFHRFMLRPMNVGRWLTASRAELSTYERRSRFLRDHLEARSLRFAGMPSGEAFAVAIEVGGLESVEVLSFTAPGLEVALEVYADEDDDGTLGPEDPLVAEGVGEVRPWARAHLTSAATLVAVGDEDVAGSVRLERRPRVFRYFVRAPRQTIEAVDVELESRVTGASTRRRITADDVALASNASDTITTVPRFAPGETSPHPWRFDAEPRPQTVRIAGAARLDRRYGAHTTVVVEPGAELTVDGDVTFLGRVELRGDATRPIHISGGPVVLRGPATAGSRIDGAEIRGSLAVLDTHDITVEDVRIRESTTDDALHATYVDRLALHEVTIVRASTDAVDLEHVTADVRGLVVLGAEDECLDLMNAEIRLTDALLVHCKSNAISAGEESDIRVVGSVIVGAKVGVLAKNASNARIARSLIYRTKTALKTNRRDVHYDAPSTIDADDVHAVDCGRVTKRAKNTQLRARASTTWPVDGRLDGLRRDVLRIEDYATIDAKVGALMGGAP